MAGTGHPPGKPKHKVRNLLLLRKGIFRFKMLEEISGEYCQGKEEIKNLILEASPCFEPARDTRVSSGRIIKAIWDNTTREVPLGGRGHNYRIRN